MIKPIEIIIRLLPGLCGLFWLMTMLMIKNKNSSQKILIFLATLFSSDLLCQGMVLSSICTTSEKLNCEIISAVASLAAIPIAIIFIHSLRRPKINILVIAVSVIPFLMTVGICILFSKIVGTGVLESQWISLLYHNKTAPEGILDIANKLHRVFIPLIYWCLYAIGVVVLSVFSAMTLIRNKFKSGDLYRFLFKEKESSAINLSCCLILLMLFLKVAAIFIFIHYNDNRSLINIFSIILTLCIYFLMYTGVFFSGKKIRLKDLMLTTLITSKDAFLDLKLKDALNFTSSAESKKEDELLISFREYIEDERHYLDQDLTLDKVCQELGTNRTYISLLMNDKIRMPFRTYINNLRIKEAKRLMMENPDEILDSIAVHCGFSSDSQLVRKFTELEGVTPRIWLNSKRGQ